MVNFIIKLASKIAEKKGYKSLYSDTDSLFIKMPSEDADKFASSMYEYFNRLAKKLNANPGKIILEYENYYDRIAFLAKKRYFGSMVFSKGNPVKDYINVRGLEVRRNDIPDITKGLQQKVMRMIMLDRADSTTIHTALDVVRDRIVNNKVTLDDITCYKSISKKPSEYEGFVIDKKTNAPKIKKDGTQQKKSIPVHVKIAKKMVRQGKEFYVGMQIPYVILDTGPLNGIHIDEYTGIYDKSYYWNDVTYEPIKRMLDVTHSDYDWESLYIDV